jgi:outer membrane receptor protein involved in Fe transport
MLRALCIWVALALAEVPAALAESDAPALTAPIAAQPLAKALEAFAQQTGLHLMYVSGVVHNQTSQPVPAGLSADQALARLLQGTGLKSEFLTARSVRILADERSTGQSPLTPDQSQPSLLSVVVVTGSRIAVPANITATSPLVVVTAQDIVLMGHTDTGDVISALPQMITTASDSGNYVNHWGTATANLRGLGPQRTVVLVNGKRLGLGDPNTANPNPAPDLDQVPLPMIERVEVLTGGASATYGSDAVAGVVNFILKDHVQGVQIDAQYGFAQHAQHNYYLQGVEAASGIAHPTGTTIDGFTRDVSVLAGTGFHDEEGHVTGYFVYHGQDALYGSDRDFTACTGVNANYLTDVPTQRGVTCFGSLSSNFFDPTLPMTNTIRSSVTSLFRGRLRALFHPRFNYAPYQPVQRQTPGTRPACSPMST